MGLTTVVIVARTKMYGGRVCVGALSDDGEHLRLMNTNCASDFAVNAPYHIGERWEVTGSPCGERRPPHLEDFMVGDAKLLGKMRDLVHYISQRAKPWKGEIDTLFDGKIQFTQKGAGYIAESDVPHRATGFWVPSSDLVLQLDERGKNGYSPQGDHRHLSYVGLEDPIQLIKEGQWVRVSLARWWKSRDAAPDFEERCYAQLSGWY